MSTQNQPLTHDEFVAFAAAVLKALPRDIDPEVARKWAHYSNSLAEVLTEALSELPQEIIEREKEPSRAEREGWLHPYAPRLYPVYG